MTAFVHCPHCFFRRSWVLRRRKRKCKKCRKEFSSRVFPITGFRLTKEEWKNAAQEFILQKTIRRMAFSLKISMCSAQKIANYFRKIIACASNTVFEGPVEIDETYIGGQRKNKKLHIRRLQPSKVGLGTQKLPIFGIFDRKSGEVFVEVLSHTLDVAHIIRRVHNLVRSRSVIYTDGFPRYQILALHGYQHEWIDHSRGEYARGAVHTNNIEGFWGILKRTMGCIGGVRRKRLPLFAKEIAWRFSHRKLSLHDQISLLLNPIFGGRF